MYQTTLIYLLDVCLISIRKKILAFKTSDNVKLKNDLGIRDGVKNFIDFCGVVDWGIDRMWRNQAIESKSCLNLCHRKLLKLKINNGQVKQELTTQTESKLIHVDITNSNCSCGNLKKKCLRCKNTTYG